MARGDPASGFDGWLNGRKRFHGNERAGLAVVVADGERLKFNPLATQAWWLCLDGGPKRYRPQLFGDILIVVRTLNA